MQWEVYMRTERLTSVTVEADSETEARVKALEGDIVGDERIDHIGAIEITRVISNS